MSKKRWTRWGLLLAGTTLAGLSLGACIAQYIIDTLILRAVN